MTKRANWPEVWQQLCTSISQQPRCPQHPEYPCVRTLSLGIINDILEVSDEGILVRSHRTLHDDFIEASRFEVWWKQLSTSGQASLVPGGVGNPHRWRARIVGAIMATCLPELIKTVSPNTLEYR